MMLNKIQMLLFLFPAVIHLAFTPMGFKKLAPTIKINVDVKLTLAAFWQMLQLPI